MGKKSEDKRGRAVNMADFDIDEIKVLNDIFGQENDLLYLPHDPDDCKICTISLPCIMHKPSPPAALPCIPQTGVYGSPSTWYLTYQPNAPTIVKIVPKPSTPKPVIPEFFDVSSYENPKAGEARRKRMSVYKHKRRWKRDQISYKSRSIAASRRKRKNGKFIKD